MGKFKEITREDKNTKKMGRTQELLASGQPTIGEHISNNN